LAGEHLELADLKELKFWNLKLTINTMLDLGTLEFWPLVLASSGDSKVLPQSPQNFEDEKVLPR